MRQIKTFTSTVAIFAVFAAGAEISSAFAPLPDTKKICERSDTYRTFLQAEREATFGMGCFWKPSEELLKIDGVIDTSAGYTGYVDAEEPPNYDEVCFSRDKWVEGVRVRYNDERISYEELLNAFFEVQEPKRGSRQYASIIFPHDQKQEDTAREWLEKNTSKRREDGVMASWTKLEPLSKFYKAEGYHQNYWQKFRGRAAIVIGCVLLEMFAPTLDQVVAADVSSAIQTTADFGLKAVALLVILERFIDRKVEEI